jgi:hypothetical protein
MSTTVNALLSFHRVSIEDSDHRRKRPSNNWTNGIRVTRDNFSCSTLEDYYTKAVHATKTVQTDHIHSDHFSWNTLLDSYIEAEYVSLKNSTRLVNQTELASSWTVPLSSHIIYKIYQRKLHYEVNTFADLLTHFFFEFERSPIWISAARPTMHKNIFGTLPVLQGNE